MRILICALAVAALATTATGDDARDRNAKAALAIVAAQQDAAIQAKAKTATAPIDWETDYKAACESAKAKGFPILCLCACNKCDVCKQMDASTLKDQDVRDRSRKFIMIRLDTAKDKTLTSELGAAASGPTIITAKPDGTIIDRVKGMVGTKDMLDKMGVASVASGKLP